MIGEIPPLGWTLIAIVSGGSLLGFAISTVAWRRRGNPGGQAFAAFAVASAAWCLAIGLQFLSPTAGLASWFFRFGAMMGAATGILWFVFSIEYTGYGDRLSPRVHALIWVEPLAYGALLATTSWHTLLPLGDPVRFVGIWLYEMPINWLVRFQEVYSFVLAAVGLFLVVRFALRTRPGFRKQPATLLFGSMAVFLSSFVYRGLGFAVHPGFDPTPLVMVGMVGVIGVALFRYDFLTVTPLVTDVLFEEMTDPVVLISTEDTVLEQNAAATELLAAGQGDPDRPTVLPQLASALDRGDRTVSIELSAGRERTYDLNVSPIEDPYDRQRASLVVLRDVTVQTERERQLERQNEQLDQFASVVSHDIRNPLNVAYGFAEKARQTGDMSHLDPSIDAMEEMERLVDDLLTLAREGQTVDETEWVSFEGVATAAWPFPDDGPTLTVDSTGELDADGDRLGELLGNCFRNADDHSGGRVAVHAGLTPDGFYVEDDGPGIPKSEREDVFESGYTTVSGGTGFGLAIVESIAQAHGWSIRVVDGRDGGARFTFSGARVRNGRDRTVAEASPE